MTTRNIWRWLYCVLSLVFLGGRAQATDDFFWGLCGHPNLSSYASWDAPSRQKQLTNLQDLDCNVYRVSFDYKPPYPGLMADIVPGMQAQGIQVLPILPLDLKAVAGANTYSTIYTSNYNRALSWANYAITNSYQLPYWELGNELENMGLVTTQGDGSSETQFPDATPGGFEGIRASLNGAYNGLKDAYAIARTAGTTTITPKMLYGAAWRHWGLLKKIQIANGATPVPWDVLSWHWYTPSFGGFTAVITTSGSSSYGRTPVQCLSDFRKQNAPGEPMDIWITEVGRSLHIAGYGPVGGSCTSYVNPATSQDWALQATELAATIDDLKTVPSVKAIIVYEMYDEPQVFTGNDAPPEAYFGLVTSLNGTRKNAFFTYQSKIVSYGFAPNPQLISFRWGPGTQTGPAALGTANDLWGSSTVSSNATPLALLNTQGTITGASIVWQNGTGGQPGTFPTGQISQFWSPYDAATATLMTSYLQAYHYTNGSGAILLTFSGLHPSASYKLVLYGGGLNPGATNFNITGAAVTPAYTSGATRRLSDGPGVAYVTKTVTSSATGTLIVKTANSGSYVRLNGFQLNTP